MTYQRGKFHISGDFVFFRSAKLLGVDYKPGDPYPKDDVPVHLSQRLFENRTITYASRPSSPPVPPRTAPVREILAERQADESAASAGQAIVDGLKDAIVYAQDGEAASAYDPHEPDVKADIVPENWRDLHWKQLVALTKELGGEAANKAEAVAFIEAHLDGQPS